MLAAPACGPSLSVDRDYDPEVEFDRYYTWYWLADSPTKKTMENADERTRELDSLIRNVIAGEMREKGFTLVETNPDIEIAYHIGMTGEYGAVNWDRDYLATVKNAEVYRSSGGVIIVDMIDARTGRLMWRGKGTGAVNVDPTPEMVEKNLTRAVKKLLDGFPPG
jgi:hypothetical protein